MAANYTIVGQWPTTELQGGTNVIAVKEFAVTTKPDGLYFQFRRPQSQLSALSASGQTELIDSVADQLATRIEAVFNLANVTWIDYTQDTNPGGQLLDNMIVYVQSASGNSQGTVTIPLADIGPGDYTTSRVTAEVDALNAAEAL